MGQLAARVAKTKLSQTDPATTGHGPRPRVGPAARAADRIAEDRLDSVLGAIGDAILVLAPDGTVSLANDAAKPFLEGPGRRTVGDLLARFEPAGLTLETLVAESPQTIREAGGERRWLELSAYAIAPDRGGERILVLRDVTAARQRDAIRDSFIGVLSHELRTPLTTIYGGAKVLARGRAGLDDEIRAEIIEDIQGEADRLHRLVEDVVALTRFDGGELVVAMDPVLIQRVVPAVLGAEAPRWPEGHVEVAVQPDLPPVAGDMTYVEQVLRNLLANAWKYGGSSCWVRVEADVEGDEVVVRVLDEGPGIRDAEAARLFDLYYRSPSLSRAVSGSGIGLFVCDRLVAAMGGRVWARNRDAGGAEFGFGLRILPSDD